MLDIMPSERGYNHVCAKKRTKKGYGMGLLTCKSYTVDVLHVALQGGERDQAR